MKGLMWPLFCACECARTTVMMEQGPTLESPLEHHSLFKFMLLKLIVCCPGNRHLTCAGKQGSTSELCLLYCYKKLTRKTRGFEHEHEHDAGLWVMSPDRHEASALISQQFTVWPPLSEGATMSWNGPWGRTSVSSCS